MISRMSLRQPPRILLSRRHADYKKISLLLSTHSYSNVSVSPMDIANHSLLQFVIEKHFKTQTHFVPLLYADSDWWVFDGTTSDLVCLLLNTTSQVDWLISISVYWPCLSNIFCTYQSPFLLIVVAATTSSSILFILVKKTWDYREKSDLKSSSVVELTAQVCSSRMERTDVTFATPQ